MGALGGRPRQAPFVRCDYEHHTRNDREQDELQTTLHAIDPSVAMCRRRQQGIERIQVTYLAECAVFQAQPARRTPKSFIHYYAGKRDTEIDVLAGDDEIIAGHRQMNDADASRAPVEIVRVKHIQPIRAYNEISKSNAVAASSPTAPIVSGSAATNSCRSLAGNNRTDSN